MTGDPLNRVRDIECDRERISGRSRISGRAGIGS